MADYRAIIALVLERRSYSELVEIVGCSRPEISLVSRTVKARGITATADGVVGVGDVEVVVMPQTSGRMERTCAIEWSD